jgi:hypothetical protein
MSTNFLHIKDALIKYDFFRECFVNQELFLNEEYSQGNTSK